MSKKFNHAPRVRLYEFVADEIESAITGGQFSPGEKLLSENALASQFEVSRTVIREAFKILKERHLITVENGRGVYVLSPTSSGPQEALSRYINRLDLDTSFEPLFEVRLLIEPDNAYQAAQRVNEEDIEKLHSCMDQLRAFSKNPDEWILADLEFHATIARATKNPYMVVFIETLLEHMTVMVGSGFLLEGAIEVAIKSHALITKYISEGNHDKAREEMRNHIIESSKRMGKAMKKLKDQSSE